MSKIVNFVLPEDFILRRVFIFVVLLGVTALFYLRVNNADMTSMFAIFVSVVLSVPLYHVWQKFVFPTSLALFFFCTFAAINHAKPFISASGTEFLSTMGWAFVAMAFSRFVIYVFLETDP